MDDSPQDIILSSNFSDNSCNINDLDLLDNDEFDYDLENQNISQELITKNKKIKHLKRKIQAYEKNAENQNLKLSDYDHMLIENSTLKKKFIKLQQDFQLIQNENIQLKEMINSKNQSMIDFYGLLDASKSKFDLFNQANLSQKEKILELESKLKMYQKMKNNNTDMEQRMAEYESKMQQIKEEYNKKEELYKVKLNNQERLYQSSLKANEEEINDLKNEKNRLKNQLNLARKKNEELLFSKRQSEEQFNNKLIGKEKENEKLLRTITDLKSNIDDKNLVSRTDVNNTKNEIQRLKEENRNIYKDLSEKEEKNIRLIDSLNEANDIINKMSIEIETRDNQIGELMEEKEQLMNQLKERQNDFNEYQNSSEQEIQMLNQKLLALEEERENLIFENEQQNNEIKQLKEDLYQFEANGNIILEEKKQNDNKLNNIAHAFQIKEGELSEENEKLYKIIKKLEKENQNLQAKYEKRVNLLTLENNEASLRIRKLINTCITLKDYALSIERNMNNINLSNSMIIDNQKYRGYLQNNKNLVNGMNNILNQIDMNLFKNNMMNQTY